MLVRIAALVCLTRISGPLLGQQPENDPQTAFLRGRELIQAGQTEEGLEWIRRAATNGLLRAQGSLVELLRARGAASSRSETLRWALLAGRQGDSPSQKYLLRELRPGDPAEFFRESWPWLERMASKPDAAMNYEAGRWAFHGFGRARNYDLAFNYFSEASRDESFSRKNPQVFFLLGYLNENGFGTAQNYAVAAALYWQAAETGWPNAVYRLGLLLEHGQGVVKDASSARVFFIRAAELGIAEAAYRLGLLANAQRLNKDQGREAFNWFWQAATNGLSMAQMKVALSYEQAGLNQDADPVAALAWYQTAAKGGNRGGRIKAENLEPTLSATQRTKTEARVEVIKSMIHENVVESRPGENLLPENFAAKRNKILIATAANVRSKPRRLADARLQSEAQTNAISNPRRNDLEAGMVKIYLDDLQERVRQLANERLVESAKTANSADLPAAQEMEIILSYRLLSDGRVEDVAVLETNLAERTVGLFVGALEDASPTPRWTPRLRAELSEEYQDLLLAFGKNSVLRISQ